MLEESLKVSFDKRQAWKFAKELPGVVPLFQWVADLKGPHDMWSQELLTQIFEEVLCPLVKVFAGRFQDKLGRDRPGYNNPDALITTAQGSFSGARRVSLLRVIFMTGTLS